MKKGKAISLVLLMLTAMLQFSVSTHYCGGTKVATKLSLTGKFANCGMEGSGKDCSLPGTRLATHCCDDTVTFYGIDSNYPLSFSFVSEAYQYNFHVLAISAGLSVNSCKDLIRLYTNASPPGTLRSTNVDLSDICVLRI